MENETQTTHDAILGAIQGINQSIEQIHKGMQSHFRDDRDSFSKIDTRQDEFEAINKQNGEHFSHFNANILKLTDKLEGHMKRTEGMILAYEEDKAAGKSFGRWGKRVGAVAATIIALYTIRNFIISLLTK